MDALQSVEVTSSTGATTGFQLTFGIANGSPLHTVFLLAAHTSPFALRVILVATVNGVPDVLADGVITHQEMTRAPARAVDADDHGRGPDDDDGSPGVQRDSVPGDAAGARVALIVAKYALFGIVPLVIPSVFQDLPIPVERIPSHQGTDLAYINQLAADVGHVFYIDPGPLPGMNKAYWGPEIRVGVPQPALNTDMDAPTRTSNRSPSASHNDKEMPIVFIQEPFTKAPIPIPIPDVNPLQPPLGVVPPIPTRLDLMKDTAKLTPIAAMGRGIARAAGTADVVEGTGTLDVLRYGRLLKARRLVGVRGAGMAFDGLYYVKSVTSTLKRGEFKQWFSLTRNGLISITPRVPV